MPTMDQEQLARSRALEASGDTENPEYMELLADTLHAPRAAHAAEEWPDPVQRAFAHINRSIYVPMQGPSELGASGRLSPTGTAPTCKDPGADAGHRRDGRHDGPGVTWSDGPRLPQGRFLLCPTAVTWRCTTTSSCISAVSWSSCTTWQTSRNVCRVTRQSGPSVRTGWDFAARFSGMSTTEKWGYGFWLFLGLVFAILRFGIW